MSMTHESTSSPLRFWARKASLAEGAKLSEMIQARTTPKCWDNKHANRFLKEYQCLGATSLVLKLSIPSETRNVKMYN